jgi:hypothetical protein
MQQNTQYENTNLFLAVTLHERVCFATQEVSDTDTRHVIFVPILATDSRHLDFQVSASGGIRVGRFSEQLRHLRYQFQLCTS